MWSDSTAAPTRPLLEETVDESSTLSVEPVSLGKSCNTSVECQVRDPFSACIDGICECISKTSTCSSLNRGRVAQ